MIDLTGKLALVTGASRGIGRACALRLAEAGADVVLNYVSSQTEALAAAEEIRRLGRRSAVIKADVSEPEDVAAMLDFVRDRFERLDILVSNAAGGGFRPLLDATDRHFEVTMNTNVRALLHLVRQACPLLERSSQGKVIALSSHGSHLALPAYGLIGASKAALESLMRHFALELGPRGINFNVVLAGLVETDATRNLPGSEQMFAAVQGRRPLRNRALLPRDVAAAVVFLASELSDLVQGQTLVVDGGETLGG